jgi:hypothetical protein
MVAALWGSAVAQLRARGEVSVKVKFGLLMLGQLALLAACGRGVEGDPAAQVVEEYMRSIVNEDAAAAVSFSCAAWESGARAEAASLASVRVELPEIRCSVADELGANERLVTCEGVILASYRANEQEIPLAGRNFRVVMEDGEWRMCGYR